MANSFHLFGLVLVLFIVKGSHCESEPMVTIRNGRILGSFMTSSSGQQFLAFQGIFYAEAPTGNRRFKEPVPARSWNGKVFDATREGPTCLQYDSVTHVVKGTEDCLTLNVYTHKLMDGQTILRPVMVWIHGGSFTMGSGNGETGMFGPKYFLDRNIVLVTVNYRLGPFGFLTTGDSYSPGNYGLLDQALALKWIQLNIESFGGDPDSVTIFGESAGGSSVHFHVLSPHSKGLFHRAIAQSGTALCHWSLVHSGETYTQTLARNLNCSLSSTRDVMACLKNKSGEEIIAQTLPNNLTGLPDLLFGPRIDVERQPSFIPGHPRILLETGQFNHVPFITGVNQNEGAMVAAILLADGGKLMTNFQNDKENFLANIMGVKNLPQGHEIAQRTIDQYLDRNKPFDQQLSAIDRMTSDSLIFKCTEDTIHLHTKHSSKPTYYYYYTHRGLYSMTPLLGASPTLDLGVCHGDELLLMFSNAVFPPNKTPDDSRVSEILFDLWTSFAAQGKPKSKFIQGTDWLPSSVNEKRWLQIGLSTHMMINKTLPFHERLAFWDSVMGAPANAGHTPTAMEIVIVACLLAILCSFL